jgi:hypothetical protein
MKSKSKLNGAWHKQHRMPKNATLENRIEWHLEHKENCGCGDIPIKIKEEMNKRGIFISS